MSSFFTIFQKDKLCIKEYEVSLNLNLLIPACRVRQSPHWEHVRRMAQNPSRVSGVTSSQLVLKTLAILSVQFILLTMCIHRDPFLRHRNLFVAVSTHWSWRHGMWQYSQYLHNVSAAYFSYEGHVYSSGYVDYLRWDWTNLLRRPMIFKKWCSCSEPKN